MITFDQFIEKVNSIYEKNKHDYLNSLRYGQTLMNVLHDCYKEKYKEIENTDLDCFYRDDIVEKTISQLKQNWA